MVGMVIRVWGRLIEDGWCRLGRGNGRMNGFLDGLEIGCDFV